MKLWIKLNNPNNLRDVLLGLFVNSLYGVTQDLSFWNFLLLIVSFYGIIESNNKIEKDTKDDRVYSFNNWYGISISSTQIK